MWCFNFSKIQELVYFLLSKNSDSLISPKNKKSDISQKDLSGCINREVKEALSTLNRALWDELCDYLIEIIGTEAYVVKELKEYGK